MADPATPVTLTLTAEEAFLLSQALLLSHVNVGHLSSEWSANIAAQYAHLARVVDAARGCESWATNI